MQVGRVGLWVRSVWLVCEAVLPAGEVSPKLVYHPLGCLIEYPAFVFFVNILVPECAVAPADDA